MKAIPLVVAVALLFAPSVFADSVTEHLSGTLTGIPGETITYDLTVITTITSFVDDDLSGSIQLFSGAGTANINISHDHYEMLPGEQLIAYEFGIYDHDPVDPFDTTPRHLILGYDFIADQNGMHIDSTGLPEPMTAELLLAGAFLFTWGTAKFRRSQRRGS